MVMEISAVTIVLELRPKLQLARIFFEAVRRHHRLAAESMNRLQYPL